MITTGIRAFVDRDWAAVRDSKDQYWAERIQRMGAAEALRVGDALRQQALQRDPAWPDAQLRREDLESHARVAALLRRGCADRRR